jgi:murein DD-endopeptidase MepM/ murein hydrolase activator NlpD
MWGLLAWLWENAGRVYTFFGWLYDRIVNAALNAWNWAVERANQAYSNAVWWARYYYNEVVGFVNRLRLDAWIWVQDTWARLTAQIGAALGTAWTWAQETWIRARDWTVAKWLDGIALAVDLFNRAVEGAQNLVNGALAVADALFVRAVQEAVGLFQQVQVELAEFKLKVGIDTPEEEATLRMWVTDPIGTLGAYLQLFFLDMFQFAVAYGMGTTKYNLPPWPEWGESRRGVPIPRDPAPPPGASGLVPPVDPIRISGYTFGGYHNGIDLALTRGQTVYAMHGGKIVRARWSTTGYGKMVDLQGSEWWTRYAHLDGYLAPEGTIVQAGDAIATGNSTGNSTGDHLHLEIKHQGEYIDPVTVL